MIGISKLTSLSSESLLAMMERQKSEFKEIEPSVKSIIDDIRLRGAAAVSEYVKKFDKAELSGFRVTEEEISRAFKNTPRKLVGALTEAAGNIVRFQERQMPSEFKMRTKYGKLGQKIEPFARVGVYAPGGTATYPSSVLMGCIPAKVAKVPEIVLCTPPNADGSISDMMLVAADLAGATEVYKIGGVQAIAAMAYGIKEMAPVEKIVGPGNKYVTVAKQLVQPDCDIEFLAGPSEILIIADDTAEPEMIAWDMLAQLEHDPDAKAVLVALNEGVASKVVKKVEETIKTLPRSAILEQSAKKGCSVLVTDSLEFAIDFANDYAPEHLLLAIRDAEDQMVNICNAGSIFLGSYSSVSFGDYCAGPNHVLPTMGLALTRGALSPLDFVKIIPYQRTSRSGAQKLAEITAEIARAEGLEAHARAAESRLKK
ncbi:MAG TPA: histidinol dehydrogenase [Thermoplasmata archaeon]|nr:histidinol dehydrogenase [Thermoplasmata archaeon]